MNNRNWKLLIIYVIAVVIILVFLINTYKGTNRDVPVIKVDMIVVEKEGIANIEKVTLTPGNVSYINRPNKIVADKFPAIAARVTFLRGANSVIGPWETLYYNGTGKYTFNIGFSEIHYPQINDNIHISIMIVDKVGNRIGYFVKDMVWY